MALMNSLSFQPGEGADIPHFTIHADLPINVEEVRGLILDLRYLVDYVKDPVFHIVAVRPESGEEIVVTVDDPDTDIHEIDFSPFA